MDYNARFYSPRLGRFTQPDTIVPGMSSQAYNRYSYVNNNLINLIDPSGHAPCIDGAYCGDSANEYGNGNTRDDVFTQTGSYSICGNGSIAMDLCEDDSPPERYLDCERNPARCASGKPASTGVTPPVIDPGRNVVSLPDHLNPEYYDDIASLTQDLATFTSGVGVVALVGFTAVGCLVWLSCVQGYSVGVGFHWGVTNRIESTVSNISLAATATSDTLKGNHSWDMTESIIPQPGRDTSNSLFTAALGEASWFAPVDFGIDLYSSAYNRGKAPYWQDIIYGIQEFFTGTGTL